VIQGGKEEDGLMFEEGTSNKPNLADDDDFNLSLLTGYFSRYFPTKFLEAYA
jgi:hypothetical protein